MEATSGSQAVTIATLVVVAVLVVHAVCLWRIYRAMGQSAWSGIVPLLNAHVAFQLRGREWWWVLLLVVPCVGWVVAIIYLNDLSRLFGRSIGFTVGLVLAPTVFLAILAFGRSTYVGPTERVV